MWLSRKMKGEAGERLFVSSPNGKVCQWIEVGDEEKPPLSCRELAHFLVNVNVMIVRARWSQEGGRHLQ